MSTDAKLGKILESSTFRVHDGDWVYAKVQGTPQIEYCFMLSRDSDETTAVFEQSKRDKFEIIEENKDLRKLIEIHVSVPFYSVGFLAAISRAVAEQGLDILVVSTYSKDCILINSDELETVKTALLSLGLRQAD